MTATALDNFPIGGDDDDDPAAAHLALLEFSPGVKITEGGTEYDTAQLLKDGKHALVADALFVVDPRNGGHENNLGCAYALLRDWPQASEALARAAAARDGEGQCARRNLEHVHNAKRSA